MGGKKTTESNGQRHAPTVNRIGSSTKITQSIELMVAIHHALKKLSTQEAFDLYFFDKVIAIFTDTKKGVYHAGDLLSQHILVIGACVGLYPLPFAALREIGDTTCRKYIQEHFNFF